MSYILQDEQFPDMIKTFVNVVNIHFTVSYHYIPSIICRLGPDRLAVWTGSGLESGL